MKFFRIEKETGPFDFRVKQGFTLIRDYVRIDKPGYVETVDSDGEVLVAINHYSKKKKFAAIRFAVCFRTPFKRTFTYEYDTKLLPHHKASWWILIEINWRDWRFSELRKGWAATGHSESIIHGKCACIPVQYNSMARGCS